jgi:hypothetical protein
MKAAAENRCVTCGEHFRGETAEARHAVDTKHRRFEMVLDAGDAVQQGGMEPGAPDAVEHPTPPATVTA